MTERFLPFRHHVILASLAILAFVFSARAQETQPWSQNTAPLPAPTGFVNDYAGVIDATTKQSLEATLKNLKETTNPPVEIAVAVVKTTGERPIFDYSLAVARGWGIGSKQDDNPSALLFIAVDDRKYFTQVSRDLEDELPDGTVGALQRQFLVPEFRKGNYGKGITDTVNAYIDAIRNKGNTAGNTNAAAKPTRSSGEGIGAGMFGIFCCAVIVIIILIIIFSRSGGGKSKGDRDRWGGGGFGSSGGGSSDILPAVLGGIIGSSLGGGGGSSSSDWGSSGGSDWGGFGGGGDFGGGGGGGDW
jgi:uncharacterized protein